jgi:hypothetical protein
MTVPVATISSNQTLQSNLAIRLCNQTFQSNLSIRNFNLTTKNDGTNRGDVGGASTAETLRRPATSANCDLRCREAGPLLAHHNRTLQSDHAITSRNHTKPHSRRRLHRNHHHQVQHRFRPQPPHHVESKLDRHDINCDSFLLLFLQRRPRGHAAEWTRFDAQLQLQIAITLSKHTLQSTIASTTYIVSRRYV